MLSNSLRQKAQTDFGFAAFFGVPFGFTGTRVPAASAFLCSRWMRSFLEIGMLLYFEFCEDSLSDEVDSRKVKL